MPFQLIVCDVSFISLTLATTCDGLSAARGQMIALIKPQFEVGRQGLDKGGIVKDESLRDQVVQQISDFIREQGWQVIRHDHRLLRALMGISNILLVRLKCKAIKPVCALLAHQLISRDNLHHRFYRYTRIPTQGS